jgi:PAS domain S-box-containing protein
MQAQSSSEIVLSSLSKFPDQGNAASMRLIADAIPQIVWIANPEENFEFFNRAWYEFTGLAVDESISSGWKAALHPDDLSECRQSWLQAVGSGNALEVECRFRRASDGMYRWHLTRAHALKNEVGEVIKWIGSSTDINDQKVAQHALREVVDEVERQVKERTAELLTTNMQLLDAISERRHAAAMHERDTQRLNDIIATQAHLVQAGLNLPSFLKLAAEKIHRLTGAAGTVVEIIEDDEVVSAAAAGITVPFIGFRMNIATSLSGLCIRKGQVLKCANVEQDPRVDRDACLKVGAASLAVAPLFNKGVPIGALKILSNVPDAFGQRDLQTLELVAGLLGAAVAQQVHIESNQRLLEERTHALSALQTEIENRLRSEQQLRASEKRTRTLLESSHDAFFGVNAEGVIVDWSAQAERMFEWSGDDAIGKQFAPLLFPEYARARILTEIDLMILTGEDTAASRRIVSKALLRSGAIRPIELSIFSIRDNSARVVDVFVRDLGGQRKFPWAETGREKALRTVADSLPAWIAYIDKRERYLFANAYYSTNGGRDPNQMIGLSLREVLGEERYAGMKDKVNEAKRGIEVRYSRTIDTQKGPIRQQVHYVPDIAENGAVLGFYSIVIKATASEERGAEG